MPRENKRNGGATHGKGGKAFPEKIIAAPVGGITKKGGYVLVLAAIIIVAGYIFLSKAAPDGRDTWSNLAAILLILGYLLIPFGIMARKTPSQAADKALGAANLPHHPAKSLKS